MPKNREAKSADEIPTTYVPARNTIFLSYALAWCEVLGAKDIFIGANAVDYSGYPDCRPAFITAFEQLAAVATKAGVEGTRFRIHAPLISLSKADIIRQGAELGVDFSSNAQLLRSDGGRPRLWRLRFLPDQAGRFSQRRNAGSDSLREQVKRLFAVFALTPAEQRVIIFVVLLLLALAWFKHHRDFSYESTPPATAAVISPSRRACSPSPNERRFAGTSLKTATTRESARTR